VGDQNHHPATLNENRMAELRMNVGEMFLHLLDDWLLQIIADNLVDDHMCGFHFLWSPFLKWVRRT
jgi:hypothetical protein